MIQMTIQVKLFAALRERAGAQEFPLELPPGTSAARAVEVLVERIPSLQDYVAGAACAVNQSYVPASTVLQDGDELALIPPVSGG